jgi:flagellar hook-associated protein 2
LGQIKSKVATLQTALQAVENPLSYSAASASSSNESAVTVSSTTGAMIGSHHVEVTQLAKPAQYVFAADANDAVFSSSASTVFTETGFIEGTFQLYFADEEEPYELTVTRSTTIEDLSTWINELDINVAATITQTISGQYALIIQGTQSGTDNDFTFGLLSDLSEPPISSAAALVATNAALLTTAEERLKAYGNQAQDAKFILDGVMEFTRTTNNISDLLSGTTFNLVSTGSATITLAAGSDKGQEVIQAFITAFNDLASTSKKLTQKGSSSTDAG